MPLKLVIVGDGPLSEQVHQAARHHPTIEYMGRQPPERVLALMREASFLVFPSGCYENMPRVIVEAFACGTPVIASRLGAMPELITSGQTGLHFRAGEADDLRSQVNWMLSHPAELHQMRQAARAEFEARYTAERNYQRAIEIYETVIASARVK